MKATLTGEFNFDDLTHDGSVLREACKRGHKNIVRYPIGSGVIRNQISYALTAAMEHVEISICSICPMMIRGPVPSMKKRPTFAFQWKFCSSIWTIKLFFRFLVTGAALRKKGALLRLLIHGHRQTESSP
jgi:hypothetical protein